MKCNRFYFFMCLAGFLLILLPVGIANFVFGYILGDSPCTLCWGQREAMIFIGLIALMIVRYGLKRRYIFTLILMTSIGAWQSFRHWGAWAPRDVGQGFGLAIFGIHTYFWAGIVFWSIILILGFIFLTLPKDLSEISNEIKNNKIRKFNKFSKFAFITCAIIIGSNAIQAFISTGLPPYYGQGNPVRFTLNPKHIIWSDEGLKNNFKTFSILGKMGIADPDYAFAPNKDINFIHNQAGLDFNISKNLKILKQTNINIKEPINSIIKTKDGYFISSKYSVDFLNNNLDKIDGFEIDPYWNTNVMPIVGIASVGKDDFVLFGSNKGYLFFKRNPKSNEKTQFMNFIKGYDKYESVGDNFGRGKVITTRSKYHYIGAITSGDKYIYALSLPNKNDNKLLVMKILKSDREISAEFELGKNLKDLYITSAIMKGDEIYALSKNHNVIIKFNPNQEVITEILSYPSNITNARALMINNLGEFQILSYQDGKNILFTLE